MASTSQKWLLGCGIGCAALIVLIVIGVTGAVIFVRDKVQPLQQAAESGRRLVTAYGRPETFVPPPDGVISRERMEAFLSIRDSLKDAQARMEAALDRFDVERLNDQHPSFWRVMGILSDVSNVLTPAGEYLNLRNRELEEKRMGLGEYAYIYSISYHSWLGHPPDEGPPIIARLRDQGRVRVSADESPFSGDAIRRQYRRLILQMLKNQLNGVKDTGQAEWHRSLEQEVARLEGDSERIAWQDNVPPQLEECLKPYRTRLEASYRPASNCFELFTLNENSQFAWNEPGVRGRNRTRPAPAPEDAEPAPGLVEMPDQTGAGRISYIVGAGVKAPVPVAQPAPKYTDEAQRSQIAGLVTVRAVIRKDGSVGNTRVIRGLGYGLDESATNTIEKNWRFKPGTLDGTPVEVQADIQVAFRPR